jgi:cyclase
VASIDAKIVDCGEYECFSNNGKIPTGKDPAEWAVELERSGAGEILITSIEQDGTMGGYDIDLVKEISESVSIPVIASGGARDYLHMLDALQIGGASAVATASIF